MQKRHPLHDSLEFGQRVILDEYPAESLAKLGYRPQGPLFEAAAPREVPELLRQIHQSSVDAGVNVLCACTGNTTVRSLARGGLGMRASAMTHQAVDIALDATQKHETSVAVAGVLATLTNLSPHDPHPLVRVLSEEHLDHAKRLATTGCHLVLVTAMPTLEESLAAVSACKFLAIPNWVELSAAGASADVSPVTAAKLAVGVGAQAVIFTGKNLEELKSTLTAVDALELGVPLGVRLELAQNLNAEALNAAVNTVKSLLPLVQIIGFIHATTDMLRTIATQIRPSKAA